ncbi:MAG: hypothetical protein AB8G17_11475 [Gammaproteobacteria bacterium]
MASAIKRLKSALFLSIVDIGAFLLVFVCVEFLYLNKSLPISINHGLAATLFRFITLQIVVQTVVISVLFYFTRNVVIAALVMIALLFLYSSLLRGELIPLELLFGFGVFGKTTPGFFVYLISTPIAVAVFHAQRD